MDTSKSVTFAALADPTRLAIIDMLATQGELTATKISQAFSSTPPAISQHLKVLREAGIARMRKHGQKRIYSLNAAQLDEAEQWIKQRTKLWNSRLDAMEVYLAEQHNKKENL